MKVVKITALWCSACLIMNKRWDEVLKEKEIETISLDLDMDEEEVANYQVGDILPVFIFYKEDREVKRIVGEKTAREMLAIIKEVEEAI